MNSPTPIVIAHRGASGYLPEHTLEAKALAHAMGADFIEQDVVLSRDGVPIVLHDIFLDSTTDVQMRFPDRRRSDGRFYAIDFTLVELRQLQVHERSQPSADGSEVAVYPQRFPPELGNFRIPTLADEIDLIIGLDKSRQRRTGLYVELKAPNWHLSQGQDIAATVLAVLREKNYADRPDQVYLQCFDDHTLRRLRDEFSTPLPLIQLIGDNNWGEDSRADYDHMQTEAGLADVAEYADGVGPWLYQIYQGRTNDGDPLVTGLVDRAQALGLKVHPYTFRRDELPPGIDSFRQLLELFLNRLGVDGLFTDFPDEMRKFIDEQHSATGI